MARIRSIKPQFWEDTEITKLSFEARLLYIGLWNFMDVNGVCEDNEMLIKRNVFPYEAIDVGALITELCNGEFLKRYQHDDKGYLFCPTFKKHQKLSDREKVWHPEPTFEAKHLPVTSQSPPSHLPVTSQEDKEKEKDEGLSTKEKGVTSADEIPKDIKEIVEKHNFTTTNLENWAKIAGPGGRPFVAHALRLWDMVAAVDPQYQNRPPVTRFNDYLAAQIRKRDKSKTRKNQRTVVDL